MSEPLGAVSAPAFRAVAGLADLEPAGKVVVTVDGIEVLLLRHDDRVVAMANRCIHRDRELVQGFLLKGRLVCPGHQWSFDLDDGYCKERDRTQPVFEARVVGDTIEVAI